MAFNQGGCPIRISVDQCIFATPHRFSQLITSFFASESLGIPHTPLLTFFQHSVYTGNYSPAYLLLFAFSLLFCFYLTIMSMNFCALQIHPRSNTCCPGSSFSVVVTTLPVDTNAYGIDYSSYTITIVENNGFEDYASRRWPPACKAGTST